MSFIQMVPEDLAEGNTASMYSRAKDGFGYLPNMVTVFSHRPEVMEAWNELITCIKKNMDVRRYELANMAFLAPESTGGWIVGIRDRDARCAFGRVGP